MLHFCIKHMLNPTRYHSGHKAEVVSRRDNSAFSWHLIIDSFCKDDGINDTNLILKKNGFNHGIKMSFAELMTSYGITSLNQKSHKYVLHVSKLYLYELFLLSTPLYDQP
jgi:hypothetical protein